MVAPQRLPFYAARKGGMRPHERRAEEQRGAAEQIADCQGRTGSSRPQGAAARQVYTGVIGGAGLQGARRPARHRLHGRPRRRPGPTKIALIFDGRIHREFGRQILPKICDRRPQNTWPI